MDGYQLLAEVLWAGLGLWVVAAIAGVQLGWRGHRNAALGLLLAAALGTAAFSLISGFSIGRFTAVLPALLAGYMLALGRGWLVTVAALLGTFGLYVICSWVLTELEFQGGIFALIFGAWAIPFYALAALGMYAWSAKHPVARKNSKASEG